MPSTWTTRNRLEKQAPGENNNTWSANLNDNTIQLTDEALDGVVSFTLSGSKTLTSNESATDEARKRVLNVTGGSGGTITIPNLEKTYIVRNASTGTVTVTTGTGTTAAIPEGVIATVISTGSNQVYAGIYANVDGDYGSTALTAGGILASGSTGVGYTTGAGGTVTQATSKSTGVTINELSGTITTSSAALAADTQVAFIVSNSTVGAADSIIVNVKEGTSNTNYSVRVGAVTSGAFAIIIKNETAGSLSTAIEINFAVIKGATS